MVDFIDEKYATLVGDRYFDKFAIKKKDPFLANMRCSICGDSQKNKSKKRGYIYTVKDSLCYKCHNCHASFSLQNLLKEKDQILYKEYLFEKFRYNNDYRWNSKRIETKEKTVSELANNIKNPLQGLIPYSEFPKEAKDFIEERKIPQDKRDLLHYSENYMKWIKDNIDDSKFDKLPKQDKRIVIPFRDMQNKIFAYQGRTITDNSLRYLTINESRKPLIFGLERIKKDKTVYIVEGPFDSLFLENSIAVAGSALKKLLAVDNKNFVYVFDNEPRNEVICALMEEIIDDGKSIVIWPNTHVMNSIKDINDIAKLNLDIDMERMLKESTYNGMKAKLQFGKWKKI